jgi:hypothetical protein
MIDEISDCKECFIPIFKRHGGMSEQCKAHLHYVAMFAFSSPVLLVGVREEVLMRNTN